MAVLKQDRSASFDQVESEAERSERLAWESQRLDEADAEIAAGKVISGPALDAWLKRFATGEPLPPT